MTITVLHNQSLLDIAIQHTGSVFNAFSLAAANDLAISDSLLPGSKIFIPETIEITTDIANYYSSKALQPATAYQENEFTERLGIGWFKVGQTFKIY
ncbi:hypothetical protein [Chryseobacterium salviniae]|uniref:LysM domain-containing protein n=1 Tax=Chryseobacterium salviniae TaxID=3101750 RepID=A0ABU6HSQ0_9FLAO|nr:hypothetical protein [Chryseobacterium sp. T9W2-O]MEC3875928.1 hypothetical protein [Chryseobacterium sp. T9W2-O]